MQSGNWGWCVVIIGHVVWCIIKSVQLPLGVIVQWLLLPKCRLISRFVVVCVCSVVFITKNAD